MSFKIVQPGTPQAAPSAAPAQPPVQAEAAPVAVSPEPAVAPAQDTELNPQFAELARKESVVRKAALTLQEERTKLASERQSMVPKDLLKSDLLKAAAEVGHTPASILEMLIAAGAQPPQAAPQESPLQPEIAALKAEIEALKSGKKQETDQAYQAAVKQIEREATAKLDAYPTIKARGAVSDVVELIEKNFKATGEVMPVDEASKLVEAELIEEGLKWAAINTIQEKLKPVEPTPAAPEAPKAAPQRSRNGMPARIIPSGPSNLTNKLNPGQRPLTARERAIAVLQKGKANQG